MFYFSIDHRQISYQIAALINSHNQLSKKRSVSDIQHGRTDYIVEVHGNWILGAVGIDRQSYTFSEIKHLVVHPEWRGKGIAKHLLQRALKIVNTKMVYATVREDNRTSLNLFEGFGFKDSGTYNAEDHKVILLVRVSPQWGQKKSASKSSWSDVEKSVDKIAQSQLKSLKHGLKTVHDG